MAVAIVDSLIWLKPVGIWVARKRRRLVFRLDGGEIERSIVMFICIKVFIEVLEHSHLGILM
jgi:hypothetical protein